MEFERPICKACTAACGERTGEASERGTLRNAKVAVVSEWSTSTVHVLLHFARDFKSGPRTGLDPSVSRVRWLVWKVGVF